MTPAPKCVAYTRVSSEDQAGDEKASLRQQAEAVAALARKLGAAVGETFTDPGRSGTTARRPAFQALIRHCETHPQPPARRGLVLALNITRWGRFDSDESAYWRVHLRRLGWEVRFAEGDSEDERARRMFNFIGGEQAAEYSVKLSDNCKRGAHAAAEAGRYATRAPLGYAKGPDNRLVPDAHAALVRAAFERYDTGAASIGDLARELQRRAPGLRRWGRQVVKNLLKNPAYAGDVVWHDRRFGPVKTHTRDAHPPLVGRALWDRVQQRLADNYRPTRHTFGGYPLSGLLVCSDCGAAYKGAGGPKGPAGDPDRYRFYRENGSGDATCGHRQGTLQKRVVEPLIIREVAKVVARADVQRLIRVELQRVLKAAPDTRRAAEVERQRLEAQRTRLVERIAAGTVSDAEAKPVLDQLRARIAALAADAERAAFAAASRKTLAAEQDRLLAMARDFEARARRLGGAELRELLKPWLANAVVDKATRTVTLTVRRVPVLLPCATSAVPS